MHSQAAAGGRISPRNTTVLRSTTSFSQSLAATLRGSTPGVSSNSSNNSSLAGRTNLFLSPLLARDLLMSEIKREDGATTPPPASERSTGEGGEAPLDLTSPKSPGGNSSVGGKDMDWSRNTAQFLDASGSKGRGGGGGVHPPSASASISEMMSVSHETLVSEHITVPAPTASTTRRGVEDSMNASTGTASPSFSVRAPAASILSFKYLRLVIPEFQKQQNRQQESEDDQEAQRQQQSPVLNVLQQPASSGQKSGIGSSTLLGAGAEKEDVKKSKRPHVDAKKGRSGGGGAGENTSALFNKSRTDFVRSQEFVRWQSVMSVISNLSCLVKTTKGKAGKKRYDGLKIEEMLLMHKSKREMHRLGGGSPDGLRRQPSMTSNNSSSKMEASSRSSQQYVGLQGLRELSKSSVGGGSSGGPVSPSGLSRVDSTSILRRSTAAGGGNPHHHDSIFTLANGGTADRLMMSAVLGSAHGSTGTPPAHRQLSTEAGTVNSRSTTRKNSPRSASINLIDPAGTSVRSLISGGVESGSRSDLRVLGSNTTVGSVGEEGEDGRTTTMESEEEDYLPKTLGDVYMRICVDQEINVVRSIANWLNKFQLNLSHEEYEAKARAAHKATSFVSSMGTASSSIPSAGAATASGAVKPFNALGGGDEEEEDGFNIPANRINNSVGTQPQAAEGKGARGPQILNDELTDFDLSSFCCGNEGSFAALGVLFHTPAVKRICLKGCRINDKTVEFLCLVAGQALPLLEEIDLSGNPKLAHDAGKALQRYASLPETMKLSRVLCEGTNIRKGCVRSIEGHIERKEELKRERARRRAQQQIRPDSASSYTTYTSTTTNTINVNVPPAAKLQQQPGQSTSSNSLVTPKGRNQSGNNSGSSSAADNATAAVNIKASGSPDESLEDGTGVILPSSTLHQPPGKPHLQVETIHTDSSNPPATAKDHDSGPAIVNSLLGAPDNNSGLLGGSLSSGEAPNSLSGTLAAHSSSS